MANVWLIAARPKTLWAGVVPVFIGGAIAFDAGSRHWLSFVCALAGSVLIQIGTNYANDYLDFVKQTDSSERIGPLRVTQAGLVTPSQIRTATMIVFGMSVMIGLYLVIRAGWPVIAIGLTSIAFGVLYTGGPRPLGYLGLGDLLVLIFYGPVAVAGTHYVMTLSFSSEAVLLGLSPGLFSVAILVVNNLRDIESDRKSGKRTLAVRLGPTFAKAEYVSVIIVAALQPAVVVFMTGRHPYSAASALVLIPAAIPTFAVLTSRSGESLNTALADTGRLLALFGLLFCVGWLL
jgi:1,4-dihydroxy-2-naphthoate octaprenyltransferase